MRCKSSHPKSAALSALTGSCCACQAIPNPWASNLAPSCKYLQYAGTRNGCHDFQHWALQGEIVKGFAYMKRLRSSAEPCHRPSLCSSSRSRLPHANGNRCGGLTRLTSVPDGEVAVKCAGVGSCNSGLQFWEHSLPDTALSGASVWLDVQLAARQILQKPTLRHLRCLRLGNICIGPGTNYPRHSLAPAFFGA